FLAKNYEAVATIFIEDSRRGSASVLRDWMPSGDASFQQAILRSRTLAEAVVDSLPAETTDELLKRAMRRDYLLGGQNLLRKLLGREPIVYSRKQRIVQELVDSRVRFVSLASGEVEIRAVAYHPQIAMDLANTYVAVLQTHSRSHLRDEARATRQFIESLLAQTKASLQEAENSLTKFQVGGGVGIRERPAVETAQLAQLETSLADLQASKEIVKVRLNALKTGTGPAVRQTLSDRLAPLEAKRAALLEKDTPEHPLVKAAETEINELKATLAARPASSPGSRPSVPVTL